MLTERLVPSLPLTPRRERGTSQETLFSSNKLVRSPLWPRPDLAASPLAKERLDREASSLCTVEAVHTSNASTAINMINNYVGMVLLSQAFCFRLCGWLALPLLAVLTSFGAFTGSLIIESYETLASRNGSDLVPSYALIGQHCLGSFGKWLVIVSSIVETWMAIMCMDVIIWSNAALLFPDVPREYVIGVCIALAFPTNYLKDFSLLSFLSAFGLVCIGLIMLVVGYECWGLAASPAHTAARRTLNEAASGLADAAPEVVAGWAGLGMDAATQAASAAAAAVAAPLATRRLVGGARQLAGQLLGQVGAAADSEAHLAGATKAAHMSIVPRASSPRPLFARHANGAAATSPAHDYSKANWSGVPMAASIMLAGLTGHVGLPPMYAEMKTPSAFKPTLYFSFALMFGMYTFVGAAGYLLYGAGSHILITQDMSLAMTSGPLSVVLVKAVLLAITFKIFCSVPMCVVILVDIGENLYFEATATGLSDAASDKMRIALWLGSTACSIAAYDYLQYVTALIGMNSLLISVILPVLFYVMIHRHNMGSAAGAGFAGLLLATLVFSTVTAYVDVSEFVASLARLGADGGKGAATSS